MRIRVPGQNSGRLSDAWRFRVGTGRFAPAPAQREIGFRHLRGHGLRHFVRRTTGEGR
ncbi:hypothetical protein ACFOY2_29090 [Nonomuraea purpurea]|uniref:Uncharacterized protein n=1 Tax=Nonomuraea purpurea TaxID=1849276 RepID=A0ABV8GBI8_9ACTN